MIYKASFLLALLASLFGVSNPLPLDVVFLMDRSESMGAILDDFKTMGVSTIFDELEALRGSHFRAGIVAYGQKDREGRPEVLIPLTGNETAFQIAADELTTDAGEIEPGYQALRAIARNQAGGKEIGDHFPSEAGYCIFLFTNEDNDQLDHKYIAQKEIIHELRHSGGLLFEVGNKVRTGPNGYYPIVQATGGAFYNITNFSTAGVLQEMINCCSSAFTPAPTTSLAPSSVPSAAPTRSQVPSAMPSESPVVLPSSHPTLSPVEKTRSLDVVFLVDRSKGMDDAIQCLKKDAEYVFEKLESLSPARAGIVAFGQDAHSGMPQLVTPLTRDKHQFIYGVYSLHPGGTTEPGFYSIKSITQNSIAGHIVGVNFPKVHGYCIILLTDENNEQIPGKHVSQDAVIAHLKHTYGVLFEIGSKVRTGINGYFPIVEATGGSFFLLDNFIADSAGILDQVIHACHNVIDRTYL